MAGEGWTCSPGSRSKSRTIPGPLGIAVETGRKSRIHYSPLWIHGPSQVDWDPSPPLCNNVSDRETEIAIHSSGEATIPELRGALQCTSSPPASMPQAAHLIIDLNGLGC